MNDAVRLDPLDRRILRVLQREGDISSAALAERVDASAASCWRRVKAMEGAGVLGATVRLLDPAAVGRDLDVFCQLRMKAHNAAVRTEFERAVQLHPEVVECYSMSGEWDYLLHVVVSDVHEYERFLMRELLSNDAVANSESHFTIRRIKHTTELPV